jgi:hypothetical protein
MPSNIVPQIETIRSVARELRAVHQSPFQAMYGLPKHYPQALVEALLCAAQELVLEADLQGKFLAIADKRVAQMEASFEMQFQHLEAKWEAEEDGRVFMETCALEHSFRDIFD